jgi:hypothetical protein
MDADPELRRELPAQFKARFAIPQNMLAVGNPNFVPHEM